MSIYDTARQLKLPGAVVSAHIDPTQITPRIKKMTQTMIRNGAFKGGWNSKSLQLANTLLEGKKLPMLHTWNSWFRCRQLTSEDLAQMDEWFEADIMLEKAKMNEAQRESGWYTKRLDANLEENKQTLRKIGSEQLVQVYFRIDTPELREQVHERLLALRLPEDVAALHKVADRLDDPTHIPLKINI